MGSRYLFRKPNGKFRSAPSLEEMGFDVAKGARKCDNCGHTWLPLLVTGTCPECGTNKSTAVTQTRTTTDAAPEQFNEKV